MADVSLLQSVLTAVLGGCLGASATWLTAERRMRREFRLQHKAEGIARTLLAHPKWRLRTFVTIQHHMGGFGDDELRKILVQAGALRFRDADGIEVWGLIERNRDLLDTEMGTAHN